MKPLLIFTALFGSLIATAQNHKYDSILHQMIEERGLRLNNENVVVNILPSANKVAPTKRDAYGRLLPGIHHLPQDGMSCLVPDTKNIAAIPNSYKRKVSVPYVSNTPRIPNASTNKIQTFLYRIIPSPTNK